MAPIVLKVTGQADAVDAFRRLGADRAVSIVDPGTRPPLFPGLAADRHHVLSFHDLDDAEPGYVEPMQSDVAALVAIGRSLFEGDRLLVHCMAGISRSPAAAAVILCAALGPEAALAFLREEGPFLPNALILRIGDRLLGTGSTLEEAGRLAEAATDAAIADAALE